MIIQMSKNVVLVRTEPKGGVQWEARLCEGNGSEWKWTQIIPVSNTDDMYLDMIAMGFPQHDIALFVEAINNPNVVPFNRGLNNQAKKGLGLPRPTRNDMQLSKEPVGIFNTPQN